jgi:tRNA(Ile)-lysidine synthase
MRKRPARKITRKKSYPKPKDTGGRLIRLAIATLRQAGAKLPLNSDILIALSGGQDSVALAHLIARYGRRISGSGRVRFLHVNHGWRGLESDEDERFVTELAHDLGVPCRVVRLTELPPKGASWEAFGRIARNTALRDEAARTGSVIFTAHHSDDLAETVLWRLLTGMARTHTGGILLKTGQTYRPLLKARKRDLRAYLKEEGLSWREDETNHEGRFLRSRIRMELMPVLLGIFPRAVEHLSELGLLTQDAKREGRPPFGIS